MAGSRGGLTSTAANVAWSGLFLVGLVLIGSTGKAILDGRATALGPQWLIAGALCVPFLFVQLLRTARAGLTRRPAVLPTAALRLLVVLLVAAWLAVLALGQPFHPARTYMSMGLAIGAFALLVRFGDPLRRLVPERPRRVLDLLLTNACLILLGAEVSLRLAAAVIPGPLLARQRDTAADVLAKSRLRPGTVRFGHPVNSAGHYDREFPAPPAGTRGATTRRIACIADSFGAGVVPLPHHFTKVVEDRLLETRVFNLGVPAIGPREYLMLLREEALPLRPDLVIVNLFVGNDVGEARGMTRYGWLGSWFDRRNALAFLVPQRIAALLAGLPDDPRASPSGPLATTRAAAEEMFPWVRDPLQEVPSFSAEAFLEVEVQRAALLLAPDASYQPLFARLLEIRAAAGEVPLLISLIPDEFQVEDELWAEVVDRLPDRPSDRFRPQVVIADWLRQQRIPHLDLLPHLRSVPPLEDGRRHVYHLRDTHFNARGNRVAGEALAALLVERFGFFGKAP